ncbi:MAG: hypothetical protein Q8R02_00365 [Hyphomonadaceae bacterium]|nr:hypothetical protein [Hyphomonadaceae bacterium]
MSQPAKAAWDSGERIIWITGWAFAAAILIFGFGAAALTQDFSEPDNAMRLVRVRDLLAGQGWFDSIQHRLNPPDGVPMHWTRWIDAVIAAPVALLTPVLGQHNAEIAAAFLWPLALLAVFMMLIVKISGEIGARDELKRETQWAGAIAAALAFPAVEKFAPGFFDHHNIELVLGLAAVLGLMRMEQKPRAAGLAGLALGVAMATAAEAVPMVIAALAVAGILWLMKPHKFARGLAWLGGGLGASSIVMFLTMVPASDWGRPVCDAMSTPFLGLAVIGGAVALVLGAGAPDSLTSTLGRRLGLSATLGSAGLLAMSVLFPGCLGGGYSAMTADMNRLWMSQISETRSLLALASDDPTMIMSVAGAAFAGLVAAGFYLRSHWRDASGWIVLAFLLSAWAVLAWQIRGSAFATAFAIPFGAWAVAKARRDYRNKASAIRLLAFAGVASASAAAAWASAGEALQGGLTPQRTLANYEMRTSESKSCLKAESFKPLEAAPKGIMLNQFALGASVLVWTEHSVLAAPYHRDVEGTMTMINALRSTPEAAREIVIHSAADYVLVCPSLPETGFYAHNPADPRTMPEGTLSAQLGKRFYPDWLAPVELGDTPLTLYRVVR